MIGLVGKGHMHTSLARRKSADATAHPSPGNAFSLTRLEHDYNRPSHAGALR
jgi:hypothetical protein